MNLRTLPTGDKYGPRFGKLAHPNAVYLGAIFGGEARYEVWKARDLVYFTHNGHGHVDPWPLRDLPDAFKQGCWWAGAALELIERKADPSISPHSRAK